MMIIMILIMLIIIICVKLNSLSMYVQSDRAVSDYILVGMSKKFGSIYSRFIGLVYWS